MTKRKKTDIKNLTVVIYRTALNQKRVERDLNLFLLYHVKYLSYSIYGWFYKLPPHIVINFL